MAIVPKVPLAAQPMSGQPYNISAPSLAFGANVASRALGAMGKAVGDIAQNMEREAAKQQVIDNRAQVASAKLDFHKKLSDMEARFDEKLNGQNGKDLTAGAFGEIDSMLSSLGENIKDPTARQAFLDSAGDNALRVSGRLSSKAASARRQYNEGALKGSIELLQAQVAEDPTQFEALLPQLDEQIAVLGAMKPGGQSPEAFQAERMKVYSETVLTTLEVMAPTNPRGAKEFLDKYERGLTPKARLQARKYVNSAGGPAEAAAVADELLLGANAAAEYAPGGGGRRVAIKGIESGGRYDAKGPVTKSGDRAYGAYQVMGANIPAWTKEVLGKSMTPQEFLADPAAQDKVFDAKFGQFEARYGSAEDAASVWFTGRPRSATSGAARDALGTSGAEYVSKFSRNFRASVDMTVRGMTHSNVDELEDRLPQIYGEIDKRYADDPVMAERARDAVDQRMNRLRRTANLQNANSYSRLQEAVDSGDIQDLPSLQKSYPGALDDWNAIPMKSRRALEKVMNGGDSMSAGQEDRYRELRGMAGSDPKAFKGIDLTEEDLPWGLKKQLIDAQLKGSKTPAGGTATSANVMNKVMGTPQVKATMDSIGLRRSQAKDADNTSYWHFWGSMEAQVEAWTAKNPGATPTPTDINGFIAQVAGEKVLRTPTSSFFGLVKGVDEEQVHNYTPSEYDEDFAAQFLKNIGQPTDARNVARFLAQKEVLRRDITAKGHRPTDQDIYNILVRRYRGG